MGRVPRVLILLFGSGGFIGEWNCWYEMREAKRV